MNKRTKGLYDEMWMRLNEVTKEYQKARKEGNSYSLIFVLFLIL